MIYKSLERDITWHNTERPKSKIHTQNTENKLELKLNESYVIRDR